MENIEKELDKYQCKKCELYLQCNKYHYDFYKIYNDSKECSICKFNFACKNLKNEFLKSNISKLLYNILDLMYNIINKFK